MCGITGFVNYKKDISSYKNVLSEMTNELYNRGPDEEGLYLNKHISLNQIQENILNLIFNI